MVLERPASFICMDCGNILTEEEAHYYERRCEGCEQEWSNRLTAWRKGADDPELDAAFSVPAPTVN